MVLESLIFGLLAAFALGLSDLVAAAVSRKLGVLRTALWVHVTSVGVTTIYLLLASSLGEITLAHWGELVGLSVLGVALYLGYHKALQLGPVSLVSPIVSSHTAVVILLAVIIVGERFTGGQLTGAITTMVGVVVASVDPQGLRSGRSLISKGVFIALAATLGIGIWAYSLGVLSREMGWFLPVYVNRLLILGILMPMAIFRRQRPRQRLSLPLVLGVALVGILEIGGLFAFTRGTEVGIISIVAAAFTSYPIVPIIGGLIIFRERIAISQVVGLTIALGGLLVLGLSS
jgi:drug/metabolite transporter (DMT)-like permease